MSEPIRIQISRKEASEEGFVLTVWADKQNARIPVPEHTFNAVRIGETFEVALQFIPQPAVSTEVKR